MKITAINLQVRDDNRVNISIDGRYQFSLDVLQLTELGLKVGHECDDDELAFLKQESDFGKVYGRALEYCLMRPHSQKEVRDYLFRKTRPSRTKTGDIKQGISSSISSRVFDRLMDRGYLDDVKFATYWVENRSMAKGISRRKLISELSSKGVNSAIIEQVICDNDRNDNDEIKKIIIKKRSRYPDDQKLMAYLARQGFNFDDIKNAISDFDL